MMMNELFPGWGNWLRSEKASAQQKITEWRRMKPIVKFIHDMVQRPDGPAAYWYNAVIEETFTNTGEDYLNKLCKTPREVELMALVTDDLLPYVYHTVHWDNHEKNPMFYHAIMRLHDAAVSSVS